MSPVPIHESGANIDLSPRVFESTSVTGSPASNAETIVCTVTTSGDIAALLGCLILFSIAFTVGTSGVSCQYKIRRTNASGTTIYDSGATNGDVAAGKLLQKTLVGFDTGPTLPGQVYVCTLTVGSGAATSTVSAATGVVVVV